ncbi:MAG: EamA family transporter [Alistipes sp.]|nr:EamA family transporter [Alistipes sp.]MBR2975465.1 EamA family transporter [Alistipes sp.]
MWVSLAFLSALLLGLYDVAKKRSLRDNAVLPVLWLNTLFSTIIFAPSLIASLSGSDMLDGTMLATSEGTLRDHAMVFAKAVMVLSSWIFGYAGIKHLPLTIVGPINATRPVVTLLGAMLIFGERLNGYQWVGVVLAIVSLYLLSRASKREGVDFAHNRWIYCVVAGALIGVGCGLYDRYIMFSMNAIFVQSWYTFYQFVLMSLIVAVVWWPKRKAEPLRWTWAIPMISLLLTAGDMAYLHSLADSSAMIAIVAMIRRSSVVVSFACGAVLFGERNLRAKALDLLLILVGMIFLYIGSK